MRVFRWMQRARLWWKGVMYGAVQDPAGALDYALVENLLVCLMSATDSSVCTTAQVRRSRECSESVCVWVCEYVCCVWMM